MRRSAIPAVADFRGAPDERLLLVDPPPLARNQPEPDVVRIPRERFPSRNQFPEPVVEDASGGDFEQELLGDREPISGRDAYLGIEPELFA